MKVSYDEDIASRIGSESCGAAREGGGEALTGVRVGWVLSLEIFLIQSADGFDPSEGNTGRIEIARFDRTLRGRRPHARTQAPHKRKSGPFACSFVRKPGDPRFGLQKQVRAINPQGATWR